MSQRDYWDFIHETQDVFGFNVSEARTYYREFRDAFTDPDPPTVADLYTWGELAADLAEEYYDEEAEEVPEEDDEEEDELTDDERRGGVRGGGRDDSKDFEDGGGEEDDYWVYEGEELEVTADLTYLGE